MARAKSSPRPADALTDRTGLIVADFQTLHWGHVRLLTQMLGSVDLGIVALGSTQLHGVGGHPFSFDQKKEMVQALFGDSFRFLPLQDIDASLETGDWLAYVLGRIRSAGLPEPTDYFTGSEIDARYYTAHFAALSDPAHPSADTMTYRSPATDRQLHILDRRATSVKSGREIRFLIENRDAAWRQYVPPLLWRYIEQHYPPHLRTAIRVEATPPDNVPVGTRCILNTTGEVLALRDDGKWRPLAKTDEKTADFEQRRK
ncbi:MAG TPA: hypothetical protein VM639_18260 [Dongiaceae bacterium]|nr:hypothetical protein [Dongiaceae bacterium]